MLQKLLRLFDNYGWAGLASALALAAGGCSTGADRGSGAHANAGTQTPPGEASAADPPSHSEQDLPGGSSGSGERLIRATTDAPAAGDGTGAFRTTCLFSHMRHDDPIVAPGSAGASHLYTFFGNTATDADSTAQSLQSSGNSTCRGGIANRSAYWVPTLHDAAGAALAPEPAQIYYKSGYDGIAAADIHAFGPGLRMLAGDPTASAEQDAASWSCDRSPDQSSGSIPACEPGDHLVMTVEFPQCWNGLDLDSPDHRSHMAYPEEGRCPASHPVAIPAVTFSIPYLVPATGTAGFRLDSDDYAASEPGGFSAHGDWFDAWDADLVAVWVPRCIDAGLDCHSHLLGDGRETYFSPKDSAAGDPSGP